MLSLLAPALAALALAPAAAARADAPPARVDLVVGFADVATAGRRADTLTAAGARVERRLPGIGAALVSVPPDRVAELRSDAAVEYVQRERVRAPALAPRDPGYARLAWPYLRASLPQAWELGTGTGSTVVAVLDSGVDASHPDLPPLAPGYDFVNEDADPADDHGHGTAVAGAIAARLDNGLGAAGVCPGCTVMPVKVLDGRTGEATDTNIVRGIVWATDHGADVINISLGGPDYGQSLQDAVTYATSRGVVVVAAGGNDGSTTPQYPAALDGVIGVAASDDHDRLYSFSNHGAHLDVAAPGCVPTTALGGSYRVACGTSLAAPVVAGIVGLLRSRRPGLTRAEVESALTAGANASLGLDVRNGLVDAHRSLLLADPTAATASAVTVTGTAAVGRRLVALVGDAGTLRLSFQWQACKPAGGSLRCVDLPGKTGSALLVDRSQLGARLRVRTTALASDGTQAVGISPASGVVRA